MPWETIKQEIRERFANWETAEGFYFIGAGLAIMLAVYYYQQYLLQTVGYLFGWYWVSRGVWQMWVNRFKQERKRDEIRIEAEILAVGE
ncbi:MAG: hypothetical protein ACXW6T_00075 [Candidatus Binatia bacterium]